MWSDLARVDRVTASVSSGGRRRAACAPLAGGGLPQGGRQPRLIFRRRVQRPWIIFSLTGRSDLPEDTGST